MAESTTYRYKVAKGDSFSGLAQEYTKKKKDLTNEQAQKIIRDLNLGLKDLVAGATINLPFKKTSAPPSAPKKNRTPYEKWQDTVDQGITDTAWDEYDDAIKKIVNEYNSRLGKKSRYVEKPMPRLEWKWIKAIIWVESGGPSNPTWKTRTMHIGNPGDAGFGVLKRGEENSNIIMDEKFKVKLVSINTPVVNIKTGTAYLLNRLARHAFKSLRSETDNKLYEYTVVKGDNFSKIAKKNNTTVDELKGSNPKSKLLKPGQKLSYYKAKTERVIIGWRIVSASTIAKRYNGKYIEDYTKKLTYIINDIFPVKSREKGK